ncbi:MAG TPA: MinD/ParA family protein [Acidobacteria bacterium]|nr:MinD/ParA family protein [Acidobacteriota bacterium]
MALSNNAARRAADRHGHWMTTTSNASPPRIWAIGGGKGGVGKSVLAVNLAITLARRGLDVTLIDMDLGGANDHTLLGMPPPRRRLEDFLERRAGALADAITPTGTGGLGLIAGSGFGGANTPYAQKERLIRHLRKLPTRYVLLDLGAGTAYNVLDFFVAADLGIVVTVPEHTSVENANAFLRAAFFRRLARSPETRPVRDLVRELFRPSGNGASPSPRQVLESPDALLAEAARRANAALAGFRPAIVVNQVRLPREQELPAQMAGAVREYFGIGAFGAGALPSDRLVTQSVRDRRPVVEAYPGGAFSSGVATVAETLLAGGGRHG